MNKKRNTPNIINRLLTFGKSFFNHVKTGMKKSSTKEILKRYSICQGCEFFNPITNNQVEIKAICNICGCNLSDKKILMNKLAWKDQKCPEGKW